MVLNKATIVMNIDSSNMGQNRDSKQKNSLVMGVKKAEAEKY